MVESEQIQQEASRRISSKAVNQQELERKRKDDLSKSIESVLMDEENDHEEDLEKLMLANEELIKEVSQLKTYIKQLQS